MSCARSPDHWSMCHVSPKFDTSPCIVFCVEPFGFGKYTPIWNVRVNVPVLKWLSAIGLSRSTLPLELIGAIGILPRLKLCSVLKFAIVSTLSEFSVPSVVLSVTVDVDVG